MDGKQEPRYLMWCYKPHELQPFPAATTLTMQGAIVQWNNLSDKLQPCKKEKDMYVSQDVTVTEKSDSTRQLEYFTGRLASLFHNKTDELYRHFGLRDDENPKTMEEFIERIKKGQFTYDQEDIDEDPWCFRHNPIAFIRWTSKPKKDQKGYEKAFKVLEDRYTETKDVLYVNLQKPEEMLKALQAFEKETFH